MGAQVTIGCKLPNGLIMELVEQPQQKNSINPAPVGKRVKLNGANTLRLANKNPDIGGFGETTVDEEFWNEWYKRNKDADFIKNGFIFMVKSEAAFKTEAKDRINERTMLEPLNPDKAAKDPRMSRGVERDPEGGFISGDSKAVA
jgi:hypothetical protein